MDILILDVVHHSDVLLASGGVIERKTEDGIKIAVIRRERYGTEWSLPKGKVKDNETLIDAAYREIKEETGCNVSFVRFLATDAYITGEAIKTVFYWLCHIQGTECDFEPNDETKELLWLSPEKAEMRLTHASQQRLIRDVYLKSKIKRASIIQKISYLYSRYGQAKRWKRLKSSITAYREEVFCLTSSARSKQTEYIHSINNLLKQAELALMEGDIDRGWKCFHAARRIELLSITDKSLLLAKAEQIRDESEKLSNWRKESVKNLLPKKLKADDITAHILYEAALIRDEHYSNQAYKGSLKRMHHLVMAACVISILGWLCYALSNPPLIYFGQEHLNSLNIMYPGLITFGLLGAIFSATLKSVKTDISSRIPEMTLAIRVTLLRIVLGASAAVIIYLFMTSNFRSMLGKLIPKDLSEIGAMTFYVVAMVSGMTERLVLKVVEKISK